MPVYFNFTLSGISVSAANVSIGFETTGTLARLSYNMLVNTESYIEIGTLSPISYPDQHIFTKSLNINWPVNDLPHGLHIFMLTSQFSWNWQCINATGVFFSQPSCDVGLSSLSIVLVDFGQMPRKYVGRLPHFQPFMSVEMPWFLTEDKMIFGSVPIMVGDWVSAYTHNVIVGSHRYLQYVCYDQATKSLTTSSSCFLLLFDLTDYCQPNQFVEFTEVNGFPRKCTKCYAACKTCALSPGSFNETTAEDCTSCQPSLILINHTDPMSYKGQCLCPNLSLPNSMFLCQDCQADCFSFDIQSLATETQIIVLVTLSQNNITFLKSLESIHQLRFNDEVVENHKIEKHNDSYWLIIEGLDKSILQCSSYCKVSVTINQQYVRWRGRALDNGIAYSRLDDIHYESSESLKELSTVTNALITMSFAAGAANYVKVLFQLEQIVEYHRYLNMSLPTNFMKLLSQMTGFEYVNVFQLTQIDLYGAIADLIPDEVYDEAPIKILKFSRGVNFVRNMIECFGSFIAILFLNLLLYGITRILPCRFTRSLSQHLYLRKLNTFNDSFESIVIPVVFFGSNQLLVIKSEASNLITCAFMFFLWSFVICYPIILISYVYHNRNDKEMQAHYEDFLMDCTLKKQFTYILYLMTYYRRIVFAMALNSSLPGWIQLLLSIFTNLVIVSMHFYAAYRKYHSSSIKMALKILFNLTLLLIDLSLFFGRATFLVGEVCKICAFVAVIPGLIDSVIRMGQAIYNWILLNRKQKQKDVQVHPQQNSQLGRSDRELQGSENAQQVDIVQQSSNHKIHQENIDGLNIVQL